VEIGCNQFTAQLWGIFSQSWLRLIWSFLCKKFVAFAGFEVSGTIDEICPSVSDCSLAVGDRVVVYPTSDEERTETGLVNCQFVTKVPDIADVTRQVL